MSTDNALDYNEKDVAETLDNFVGHGFIRGWRKQNGRYLISWYDIDVDSDADDKLEVLDGALSLPQTKAFIAGIQGGMCWVGKVAQDLRKQGLVH